MKEKNLEAFARLGFCLEKSDDVGYEFEYEGMTLLYLCNEDDEDFLAIALPGFYEYDEENVATYCALSEKINASLKYVKAFTPGHSMWLCYERELFGGEEGPGGLDLSDDFPSGGRCGLRQQGGEGHRGAVRR